MVDNTDPPGTHNIPENPGSSPWHFTYMWGVRSRKGDPDPDSDMFQRLPWNKTGHLPPAGTDFVCGPCAIEVNEITLEFMATSTEPVLRCAHCNTIIATAPNVPTWTLPTTGELILGERPAAWAQYDT